VVEGVFTYPGHGYAPGAADQAARDEADALAHAVEQFAAAGLDCPVRSGASTPTVHATHADVITEIRPGVYAFNDAQQLALGTATQSDIALSIVTTVISCPSPDRFVLDAGSKTIASDRPPYVDGFGLLVDVPGARIERIWEHHAVVDASDVPAASRPQVGQRLELVPNHVCTAVNLADTVLASDGTTAVVWRVLARGRNS
jgi:D-serine deaminase-like pyridoxal phosphate-dependent protein